MRITIFAARRVLPPDLMTPAEASAARMNDTGPEAVPPPASVSFDERMRDRLTPEPGAAFEDDALVAVPAEDRLHRVVDGEDEAGRALRLRLDADVEPHRAVERRLLLDQQVGQLVGEGLGVGRRSRSSPASRPSRGSCARRGRSAAGRCVSRSGLPSGPRKYFDTTTLVASCDHAVGISTSCCSKTTSPFSPWMTALRRSHSTASNGSQVRGGEVAGERQSLSRRNRLRRRVRHFCLVPLGRPLNHQTLSPSVARPLPGCRGSSLCGDALIPQHLAGSSFFFH